EGAERVPRYDYDVCIRCYCCLEICPEAAITLKRGKLQWIMDRL
ncbi:MAG: FeS-binding protein, partial [Spirochaetales bacterium]